MFTYIHSLWNKMWEYFSFPFNSMKYLDAYQHPNQKEPERDVKCGQISVKHDLEIYISY